MKPILFVLLLFACSSAPAERAAPILAPASTPATVPSAKSSPPPIKALAELNVPGIIAGTKFSDTIIKISPDGSKLLYFDNGFGPDRAPHLLSLPGGEPVDLGQASKFDVPVARFSDDGSQLLLIGETKSEKTILLVMDATTGKVLKRLPLSDARHEIVDQDRIIAFDPEGEDFSFVNVQTGASVKKKSQRRLMLREGRLLSVDLVYGNVFRPHSKSPLEIFDAGTGELLFSVGPFPDWTKRAALSSDNTRLMLCQGLDLSPSFQRAYVPEWSELHVSIWDQRGQHKMMERGDWISADLHPSGEQLAALTDKGKALVWDLSQEKELVAIKAKDAQDIFYAAGGDTIWIEDSAGELTPWDAKTGKALPTQERISTRDHQLVAQGELLLTKTPVGVYKVWSARTGALLLDLGPNTVTFDSGFFLAASNGTLYVWKIPEELMPKRSSQ